MFRRRHRHIDPETLTEYLDMRLSQADRVRTERQLAACQTCREELEELRATVAMLRQLPAMSPRRSFVMAAPPAEPVKARPAPLLRAPQWAYAAAASVAVLALSVMVSVDATGLLARQPQLAPDAEIVAPSEPEVAEALEPTKASGQAADATPEAEPTQVAPASAGEGPVATATAEPPAAAPTPTLEPGPYRTVTEDPLVLRAGSPTPDTVVSPPVGPEPTATDVSTRPAEEDPTQEPTEVPPETEPTPRTVDASLKTPEATEKPEPSPAGEVDPTEPSPDGSRAVSSQDDPDIAAIDTGAEVEGLGQTQGTPTFWRVLEGVVAALALTLVAALVLRRRRLRQAPRV